MRTACSRTEGAPFKRSNDPAFAEKVEDVVGLYMAPPRPRGGAVHR